MKEVITQASHVPMSVLMTRDPAYCLRRTYPDALLPEEAAFLSAVVQTWEDRVARRAADLMGQAHKYDGVFELNALNVLEDAEAEIIPKPTTKEEMLAAMVMDYRSNVQGLLHGPSSAGKHFRTGSVESAARKLLTSF